MANLTNPRYRGQSLTDAECKIAVELATTQHDPIVSDLINFRAQASPFIKYTFGDSVVKAVQPIDWWVSQGNCLYPDTVSLAKQLLTVTRSSVGVEFSHFSYWFIPDFVTASEL